MPAPRRVVPTVCRLCDSACGLRATVQGDEVIALAPDPHHPLSRGYACAKGTRFWRVHARADRVRAPLMRKHRGAALEATTWSRAMGDIGRKLRAILDAHGPDAVGIYTGNAAGSSLGAVLGMQAFTGGLGTSKSFSCLTLDNSETFVVQEAVFGNAHHSLIADYARSDLVVLLGTDPLSSQPAQSQSNPNGVRELLDVARRGALVVVDPRASATARKAALHIAPRPGTDATLLAWLAREALGLHRAAPTDDPLLAAADLEPLGAFLDRLGLDDDVTAARCDISREDLDALRARVREAERPLLWSGLGVLLGPDGTAGYWLTVVIQALLGGLDRAGGWLWQPGSARMPELLRRLGPPALDADHVDRVHGRPAVLGTLPAATLADDILVPGDGRLRALIVLAGNPAMSLPDAARAREALDALELLVSVDLFVNDTGARAHAVLPATTYLEREESGLGQSHWRPRAQLQTSPALVAPAGEARDDWDILLALTRACGRPAFGTRALDALLRIGHVDNRRLQRTLVRVLAGSRDPGDVGPDPLGQLRERAPRIRLWQPVFARALKSALRRGAPDDDGLALVTSVRPAAQLNFWLGEQRAAEAQLHPDELSRRGLRDGDLARISSKAGAVEVVVRADDGVRTGTVVLPYAARIGSTDPGGGAQSAANLLVGTEVLEPVCGQPVSNGTRVWVGQAAGAPVAAKPSA